jgi:hypothetical protein
LYICHKLFLIFPAEKIKNLLDSIEEVTEDIDDESDEEIAVNDANENSGDEESGDEESGDEESGEDEEPDLSPGDIVLVLFNKRWTAEKIVSLNDIPNPALTRQLKSTSTSTSLVKFYHGTTFHRAANSRIELLAQNLVDQSRARHHPTAYLEALSDLSYG